LRWLTPAVEVDLCGHATLASMDFHTKSGVLSVVKQDDLFEMDFPARKPEKIQPAALMAQAVGQPVQEAHLSRDMLLLLGSQEEVENIQPDLNLVAKLPNCLALIVTAKGRDVDFVSRFFAPAVGLPEDHVTGSAHSTLIPFWAEKLGKDKLTARQLSKRGGMLFCQSCGDRVKIAGKARLYLQGEIYL